MVRGIGRLGGVWGGRGGASGADRGHIEHMSRVHSANDAIFMFPQRRRSSKKYVRGTWVDTTRITTPASDSSTVREGGE